MVAALAALRYAIKTYFQTVPGRRCDECGEVMKLISGGESPRSREGKFDPPFAQRRIKIFECQNGHREEDLR